MHLRIIFIAFVISIASNAEAGQRCFECHEVPTPQTCLRVTECGEHEQCFTESIITTSGSLLYNVGCMPNERCSVRERSSQFDKRADLVTCLECCSHADFCNKEGCGHSYVPQVNSGPYCFHCDIQETPNSCLDVVLCGQDEECLLERNSDFLPKVYYKSSCGDKATCLIAQQIHNSRNPVLDPNGVLVGRRNTQNGDCPACCNTNFCNNICTINNSVAIHGTQAPITTNLVTHVHQEHTSSHVPQTTHAQTTAKTPAINTHSVLTKATPVITPVHSGISSTHAPSITHVVPDCSRKGNGYIQTRHLCVKFHFDMLNFNHAAVTCAREGSILVTIDTKEKMNEIWTELHKISGYIPDLWIGGSDIYHNDTFFWQNGVAVRPYTNWGKIVQQPDDPHYHDQDCVILHRTDNYTWYDEPCYRAYGFICEHPLQAVHTGTPHSQPCESNPGFQLLEHNLGCVEYVRIPIDVDTARNYCRIFDSHLVTIESEAKQRAIFRFMNALNANELTPDQTMSEGLVDFLFSPYSVNIRSDTLSITFAPSSNDNMADNASATSWIGLVSTKPGTHSRHDWKWEAGLPYSYSNWDHVDPDADGNCVIIYTNGQWRDKACTEHHSFMCEKTVLNKVQDI